MTTNLAYTLSLLLRAHGYEVFTAFDGFQGYAEYFNHPTGFVVTDIQMPAMDGFEMTRCIRSINPNVKTIYVSGALERFEKDVESEGQQFDVAGLLKPISTTALLALVSTEFDSPQASYGADLDDYAILGCVWPKGSRNRTLAVAKTPSR
jgi:CheY-like chemotaxis protein